MASTSARVAQNVHRRNRRKLGRNQYPQQTAIIAAVSIATSKMRLSLNMPAAVSGVPLAITVNDVSPTAVTVVDSQTVDLTFATAPTVGASWVIPSGVTQIANYSGGYLAASAGTF